jgi:cytochrome b subunit of formate dehydrogenase
MKESFLRAAILVLFLAILWGSMGLAQTVEECMMCHGDKGLTKEDSAGKEISLYVDENAFSNSIHSALGCESCHAGVKAEFHETPPERVDCGACHEEMFELYQSGYHWKKRVQGVADAPTCGDCHGYHDIRGVDDEKDPAFRANQPKTCGNCHGLTKNVSLRRYSTSPGPCAEYQQSAHGKELADGNTGVAVCSDCHASHDLKPSFDQESYSHRSKIASTCGQCHPMEEEDYSQDVHGKAVKNGDPDAPVCTDCHTSHAIKSSSDPTSSTFIANLSKITCTYCHSREMTYEKYGYVTRRETPYLDMYHGVGARSGDTTTASCVSCHTSHSIRPTNDPASSINPANLPQTCGQCHKGAGENYVKGSIHIDYANKKDIEVWWIRKIYLSLIILTIGGMAAHNALIMIRFARERYREAKSGRVVRWVTSEIIWHFLLFISFVTLIITGFAFRYPDSWWSSWLTGTPKAFIARGVAHRVAGVLMMGLFVQSVIRSFLTRRGWQQLLAKFPVPADSTQVVENVLFSVGLSSKHPEFDRYDYSEKAEYWALMWGGFVMILTGAILWFETFFLSFIPKWLLDVSKAIHFYEAWLATLAILVWHFFFMFLHPENYPINFTVATGRMTEEAYLERHPADYENMIARGELIDEESDELE